MPPLITTKRFMATPYQVSSACPAPPLSLEALRGLLRSARRFELGLLAHGVAFERHVGSALLEAPQLTTCTTPASWGCGPAGMGRRSTSLSPKVVTSILISVWVFILSFYDGRLEALLDEVTRAGAAPVAASVKREIVRQHLQLQVFEAVPA